MVIGKRKMEKYYRLLVGKGEDTQRIYVGVKNGQLRNIEQLSKVPVSIKELNISESGLAEILKDEGALRLVNA